MYITYITVIIELVELNCSDRNNCDQKQALKCRILKLKIKWFSIGKCGQKCHTHKGVVVAKMNFCTPIYQNTKLLENF